MFFSVGQSVGYSIQVHRSMRGCYVSAWIFLTGSRLLLVLALCCGVEILQNTLKILKGWTVLGLVLPALQHDVVELLGTAVGALHSVASLQGADHFWVRHPWIWCASIADDLCQ